MADTGKNYRCCWRSLLTGKTGHGEWLKYRDQAQAGVDFGNQLEKHIIHWLEVRS